MVDDIPLEYPQNFLTGGFVSKVSEGLSERLARSYQPRLPKARTAMVHLQ
jgi:hypothetical protein